MCPWTSSTSWDLAPDQPSTPSENCGRPPSLLHEAHLRGWALVPCRSTAALVPLRPNQLPKLAAFLRTSQQRCVQLGFIVASDHTISPARSWQTHLVPSVTIISPWASTEKYSITFYLILQTTTTNRSRSLHLHALQPLPITFQQPELLPPLPTLFILLWVTRANRAQFCSDAQSLLRPARPGPAQPAQAPPTRCREWPRSWAPLQATVIPALCDLGKTARVSVTRLTWAVR